jgi:hypothetical protein
MRFQLLDILPNIENPVTGRIVSTADRLEQAVTAAPPSVSASTPSPSVSGTPARSCPRA